MGEREGVGVKSREGQRGSVRRSGTGGRVTWCVSGSVVGSICRGYKVVFVKIVVRVRSDVRCRDEKEQQHEESQSGEV